MEAVGAAVPDSLETPGGWRPRPAAAVLLAGGAGGAGIVGLAALGLAEPGPALVALGAAAAVTLLAAARASPNGNSPAPQISPASPAPETSELALVEAVPDPVLVIAATERDDLVGRRYILANAAARELLRLRQPQGLVVTALRDPGILAALDAALFEQREAEADYDPQGDQERLLRVLARPLAGAGVQRLALLIFHDRTEVLRVEQTRADFLANASHELRTPLASLRGFIETLRGHARDDPEAQARFLGIMQAQAERMSRLIDDLMSLSRIELIEHVPPSGPVDLLEVVRDVADSLAPQAKAREVTLEVAASASVIINGDRDQIVQVVQNLADNALKYSPPGERVALSVEANARAEPAARDPEMLRHALLTPELGQGAYAAVRVVDRGPGIAREHLPRLTERFYRVEGQKSGDRLGTGLGLAIVKHVLRRHHGGLVVESAVGRGTAFIAYLPALAPSGGGGATNFATELS